MGIFYPVRDVQFGGSTVIVPSISVGNVPQLAMDLVINTLKPVFIGYIHHEDLIPVVGPNAFDEKSGQISSSCEVYYYSPQKLIILQVRGAVVPGCEKSFSKQLVDWMTIFNAKKIINVISVAAEIRKDKDLGGCQIRYVLPAVLREELEDKLKNYGWSEYEGLQNDGSGKFAARSETQIYVPSGGFGQHLFNIGNQRGLPSLATMIFAYEGDNESEALAMADAMGTLLGLEKCEWKKPVSWRLLYGNDPPPELY